VGAGLNKDNSDFMSKIFNTIFHFPLSIFNSLSICSGRNPNLQLAVDLGMGECGEYFFIWHASFVNFLKVYLTNCSLLSFKRV